MKLRKIVWFFLSTLMFQGCMTARSEDVNRAAATWLRNQFQSEFRVFRSVSTFNEGNMNRRGFRITAAPEREPLAVFRFTADYARGSLSPTGLSPEKALNIALERVERSRQAAEILSREFQRFAVAVDPPLITRRADIIIHLFSSPEKEAFGAEVWPRLARALAAVFSGLDYPELAVSVSFFGADRYPASGDHLIVHYFSPDPETRQRSRGNLFGVTISGLAPDHPPDARTLSGALHVNSTASRIVAARGKAQRWFQDHLKTVHGRKFRVELNRRTVTIVELPRRIAFEFAACDEDRAPRHCAPEKRIVQWIGYDLETGDIFPTDRADR